MAGQNNREPGGVSAGGGLAGSKREALLIDYVMSLL